MPDQQTKKQRDLQFGKFAEELAAEHYLKKGYVIRERNWRLGKIEIDLIAQEGETIVFVEVKARSGKDIDPIFSVDLKKMKRISRGADAYLKSLKGYFEYRYDIYTLTGDFNNYETACIEDAFISPLSVR